MGARMNKAASVGARVSETTTEIRMVAVAVRANSLNSRPTTPPMNSSGMNAATSEKLIDTTVKPISPEPFMAASRMPCPASRWRWMFSTTTIASSTTNPTATTMATSVRLFRLKPNRYIIAKLAISDTPSTALTISVAESWRRNSAMTATTSNTAINRVISTSCSEARMVRVRSLSTDTSTVAGSISCKRGSSRWMRSTVSTMLAPG
ncbi:hypothetical protein ALP75_202598 [Pseudomonas syringae pv. actinidiae]|nr:hypothetical protein ALP75_202598 [Pseudomonas syringae pv. actinidiae]